MLTGTGVRGCHRAVFLILALAHRYLALTASPAWRTLLRGRAGTGADGAISAGVTSQSADAGALNRLEPAQQGIEAGGEALVAVG